MTIHSIAEHNGFKGTQSWWGERGVIFTLETSKGDREILSKALLLLREAYIFSLVNYMLISSL